MRFLRTNTATRITVGPFIDKTDGVTPKTGLTVTNDHLTLMVDTGGVPTLALDTSPTASGGSNDMVHVTGDDAGFYDLELTAADTNYLGRAMLALTDAANHCPVFHEFMIVPAMIYDSLFLGTDRLDANVTHIADTAQTARDIGASVLLAADQAVNVTKVNGTTQTARDLGAQLDATVSSRLASASYTAPPSASTIAAAVWDYLATAATTVGSLGKRLVDYLTGDIYARIGAPAGASVSADVAAVKTDTAAIKAKTDNLPTDPADASDIAAAFATVNTKLDAIDDYVDTEVAAIKAKTDNLPASPAATTDIPNAAAIRAEIDSNSTQLAAIVADTGTDIPALIGALNNVSADDILTAAAATPIAANVKEINDTALTGDGSTTAWGPA